MRKVVLLAMAMSLCYVLGEAQAQSRTWIGGELGDPSGVVVRPSYEGKGSLEFLAAWDLDEFFFLNVHRMIERPLERGRPMYVMFGPGAFVGLQDRGQTDVVLGVSGRFGIGYRDQDYRVYLAVTPRLSLSPGTDGQVGAALGVLFRI